MDSETEEITLPTLPHSEPLLPTALFAPNLNARKRPFLRSREHSYYEDQLTEALNTSSDPPLFSSDDTPDADNYGGAMKRRKKRTYKGTWWGDGLKRTRTNHSVSTDGTGQKRQFRRNFDSGIFMGDDSSATDLSSEGSLEQHLLEAQAKDGVDGDAQDFTRSQGNRKPKMHRTFRLAPKTTFKRVPQSRPVNPKDHLVRAVVQECLDKNDENVDWTGMSLDSLPSSITDLKSMIRRINPELVTKSLAPFEAELKLYLGNNSFTQLPLPLFELTNTRLLSIRQNNVSVISSSIRHLVNLQELNISSNNLQYLPFEVVEMLWHGPLKTIHRSPNPWMPLPPVEDRFVDARALLVVSSNGTGLRRFAISKPVEFLPDGTTRAVLQHRNRQPHLSEMILRSLLRHNTSRSDLSGYLTEGHSESTKKLLSTLHETQASGGRICTFCKRDIVLPRYQWYEWWEIPYDVMDKTGFFVQWETKLRDSKMFEGTYDESLQAMDTGPLTLDAGVDEIMEERVLPFQRIACGCIDIKSGLDKEVETLLGH